MTEWPSCILAESSKSPTRTISIMNRGTLTHEHYFQQFLGPIRSIAIVESGLYWWGMCQALLVRRPDVLSTPAALTLERMNSARARCRFWGAHGKDISPRAIIKLPWWKPGVDTPRSPDQFASLCIPALPRLWSWRGSVALKPELSLEVPLGDATLLRPAADTGYRCS